MAAHRKTVLITGCSPGGIGNSLAREFHARGLRVFATARSKDSIQDLSEELGIECLSLEVDKLESVEACFEEVKVLVGDKGLDYLVNNAGQNYTMPALDISLPEVHATFQTNVFAIMHICQLFTPLLIPARGTIVQIGSVAAIIPYVFGSVYNASKAALHAYSNTLRVELEPFGVKVITIVTGGVQSRIARTERWLPEGSLYKPVEKNYQRRLKHSQEGAMGNREYARRVVGRVLGGGWLGWLGWRGRKWVWEGAKARLVWWVSTFVGVGVMDAVFKWMFQLGKLERGRGGGVKVD